MPHFTNSPFIKKFHKYMALATFTSLITSFYIFSTMNVTFQQNMGTNCEFCVKKNLIRGKVPFYNYLHRVSLLLFSIRFCLMD